MRANAYVSSSVVFIISVNLLIIPNLITQINGLVFTSIMKQCHLEQMHRNARLKWLSYK